MPTDLPLFPDQASTVARRVDALYVFLSLVTIFFVVLIATLIIGFATRYRRSARRGKRSRHEHIWLEATWMMIPLLLTMVMFGWGAIIYFDMQSPPQESLKINVVGKQWMWKVEHPNGKREINHLHVPARTPVTLKMISDDVIHSFYIPAFRVKQDVLPGHYTKLWFEATRTGSFHLFCAEYCGTEHSGMRGQVTVLSRAQYSRWLGGETEEPPHVAGEKLFERYRCDGCHKRGGAGRCPSLVGVYNRMVPLASGGQVKADEQYLRDAIMQPRKHVVAGFKPIMPLYGDQLSESQVVRLIAYLKSLSGAAPEADTQTGTVQLPPGQQEPERQKTDTESGQGIDGGGNPGTGGDTGASGNSTSTQDAESPDTGTKDNQSELKEGRSQ